MWIALDRETETVYIYHEYYKGNAEPSVHAEGVRAPGEWIPGVIDAASRGRSQKDGERLIEIYDDLGLELTKSKNAVESGLYEVWQLLSSGKLKVFSTCQKWFEEMRLYRRDDKGKVVKEKDHLMDATRYAILSGRDVATTEPVELDDEPQATGFAF